MGYKLQPWQMEIALALEARRAAIVNDANAKLAQLQDAVDRTLSGFAAELNVTEPGPFGLRHTGQGLELIVMEQGEVVETP